MFWGLLFLGGWTCMCVYVCVFCLICFVLFCLFYIYIYIYIYVCMYVCMYKYSFLINFISFPLKSYRFFKIRIAFSVLRICRCWMKLKYIFTKQREKGKFSQLLKYTEFSKRYFLCMKKFPRTQKYIHIDIFAHVGMNSHSLIFLTQMNVICIKTENN